MIGAIRGEFRKLISTAMPWGFLALVVGIVGMNLFFIFSGDTPDALLRQEDFQRSLFGVVGSAGTFILILGIIGMTSEDRHKTITPSLLAEPRRGVLVAAKLVVYALTGVVYALVAVVVGWAAVTATLNAHGVDVVLSTATLTRLAVGGVLYAALAAAMGVALGVLIRNQIAAVIVAVVYFLLIEATLTQMGGGFATWTPGAAAAALGGPGALGASGSTAMVTLSMAAGGLLYLGYTAVVTAAGTAGLLRRDVS